jgi:hypothetical protein
MAGRGFEGAHTRAVGLVEDDVHFRQGNHGFHGLRFYPESFANFVIGLSNHQDVGMGGKLLGQRDQEFVSGLALGMDHMIGGQVNLAGKDTRRRGGDHPPPLRDEFFSQAEHGARFAATTDKSHNLLRLNTERSR